MGEEQKNITASDVYAGLLDYASTNEVLIYSNTSTYVAIMLPLFGVSIGAGDFSETVQSIAAYSGLFVSIVWFVVIERSRRWFSFIISNARQIELSAGFEHGRSTLYARLPKADRFIRLTPRSSYLFSALYLAGISMFLAVIILRLVGQIN